MSSHMQNPAGQGGACESTQLDKRDTEQAISENSNIQDKIIGAIPKNQREQIQVRLRTFGDLRQIDLRVYKTVDGVETGTAQGLPIRPGNVRRLIEVLELADLAARAEGLI